MNIQWSLYMYVYCRRPPPGCSVIVHMTTGPDQATLEQLPLLISSPYT